MAERRCGICSKPFILAKIAQKYCSPECSYEAFLRRHRERGARGRQKARERRKHDPEFDEKVRKRWRDQMQAKHARRIEFLRNNPPLDFMAKLTTRVYMSPRMSGRLRAQVAAYVEAQLPMAKEVVEGKRVWSPTQARVFSLLLNKVMPDLNASYIQHEQIDRPVTDLSREELERIASGSLVAEIAHTIEGEASLDYDPTEPAALLEPLSPTVRGGDEDPPPG